MNKQITIKGHVHAQKKYNGKGLDFVFFEGEPWRGTDGEYMPVCPYTISFELPAEFDPVAFQLEALNKLKNEVTAQFNIRVNQINEQIQNLMALEFNPTEAA